MGGSVGGCMDGWMDELPILRVAFPLRKVALLANTAEITD